METTRSFQDLRVWQEGHRLVITIYQVTSHFPAREQFGLTSQMRRAAVSVTSNIAEGYGRIQPKDKEHFYVMAKGSLDELHSQLILAKDLGLLDVSDFVIQESQLIMVRKLLLGLLRKHRA